MDIDKKNRKIYKSLNIKREKLKNKLNDIDRFSDNAEKKERKLKTKLVGVNAEIGAVRCQLQRPTTYTKNNSFDITLKHTTKKQSLFSITPDKNKPKKSQ